MKKITFLSIILVSISFAGCIKGTTSVGSEKNQAIAFATKKYFLGKTPDTDREMAFQEHVINSAEIAMKRANIIDRINVGFNYLISPKGAVYPFSEVEVTCLIQSKYLKKYGKLLCDDFFSNINKEFPPVNQ
jgi:hypothetical protein